MPPKRKVKATKPKKVEEEKEEVSEEASAEEEEETKTTGSKRGRSSSLSKDVAKNSKARKTDKKKTPSGGKAKKTVEEEDENDEEDEEEEEEEEEEVKTSGEFPTFKDWINEVGKGWRKALSTSLESDHMKSIYKYVKGEYTKGTCFPPRHLIFNVFITSPVEIIKVVMVGQDPYFRPNQAMGLCFSVNKGIKVPPSLVNIYKGITADPGITGFKTPKHGDLTKWATQGVFMINAILTVRDGKQATHKSAGWEKFTDEVIKEINAQCDNVVFMLWGGPAQKKGKAIDKKKHLVLEACHPSPMSAHTGNFFGCQHWSKTNAYLKKHGKEAIDWSL